MSAAEPRTYNAIIDKVSIHRDPRSGWRARLIVVGPDVVGHDGHVPLELSQLEGGRLLIFIDGVCKAVGVNAWEDLPGKSVRFRSHGTGTNVLAIGHFLKENWFVTEEHLGGGWPKTHQPRFHTGERVSHIGEGHGGRVQAVSYSDGFRYMVKWDTGPTTLHREPDLQAREAPVHYP